MTEATVKKIVVCALIEQMKTTLEHLSPLPNDAEELDDLKSILQQCINLFYGK